MSYEVILDLTTCLHRPVRSIYLSPPFSNTIVFFAKSITMFPLALSLAGGGGT